ncbi:MAG: hypothetical protein H7A33_01830 [Deltaproteobacteria bacterium]|nr:hypothetical protein [Deltaproteobacteria bacterium]
MKLIKTLIKGALAIALLSGCADSQDIFPTPATALSESAVVLPNPLDIAVDTARGNIIVSNSNVDVFYDGGSLGLLSFDATDVTAPTLAAVSIVATPNFSGQIYFDGSSNLYVPFRESSSTNSSLDQVRRYSVSATDITFQKEATVSQDPFGITGDGTNIFVVSDDVVTVFDTILGPSATIDLTEAEDANLADSDSSRAERIAVDTANNRAFVSNRGGTPFVLDLNNNEVDQVISGPQSTRDIILNGNTLYILDGLLEAVWVFDVSLLSTPSSSPEQVDDSSFLIDVIGVGNNPNALAMDAANNRLYVSNSGDDSVSVIDTLSLQEINRISLDEDDISTKYVRDGDYPFGMAVGTFNGTSFLFVACFESNTVIVINTNTQTVVEVFPNNNL